MFYADISASTIDPCRLIEENLWASLKTRAVKDS